MFTDWGQSEWLLAAALATAAFTGGTVLISALLFLQQRVDTARARPIKLSAIREAPEFTGARKNWRQTGAYPVLALRTFSLHLYNRSAVPQSVTITGFRILWPRRSRWGLVDEGISFIVPPYGGGNIVLRVLHTDWLERTPEELESDPEVQHGRSRFLIRLTTSTVSGHKCSVTRLVTFYRRAA